MGPTPVAPDPARTTDGRRAEYQTAAGRHVGDEVVGPVGQGAQYTAGQEFLVGLGNVNHVEYAEIKAGHRAISHLGHAEAERAYRSITVRIPGVEGQHVQGRGFSRTQAENHGSSQDSFSETEGLV